jgi:Fe-S cluster assembly scaffold protein SufB
MTSAVPRYEQWISSEAVRGLSSSLSDPPSFVENRLDSYERFLHLPIEPNPLYRGYGYFTNVDLSGIDADVHGAAVPRPRPLPGTIQIVHDAAGTHIDLPSELRSAGVRMRSLSEMWSASPKELAEFLRSTEVPSDKLSALSTVLLNRGYRIEIPDGFGEPIRVQDLVVLSAPHQALSVHRSFRAGAGSQVLFTEEVFSAPGVPEAQRLYASATDLDLGPDSKVVYLTVHAPDMKAVSVYRRHATTGARSRLAWIFSGFGGFRTKMRNRTTLPGNGAHVDDLQAYFGTKSQSFDSAIDMTHVGTDTHGQSITRGVFRDDSRGMSRGLVRIEHEARKTISFLSEHAMLLSRGARSDTIPILEILCRDVKATHSTSVAPVDPERVFYLESRGMPESAAIRMIGEGYLSYVYDRAPIASLRDIMYPNLAARWDGHELSWTDEPFPALPALPVTGTEAAPEWRFDSKMR